MEIMNEFMVGSMNVGLAFIAVALVAAFIGLGE